MVYVLTWHPLPSPCDAAFNMNLTSEHMGVSLTRLICAHILLTRLIFVAPQDMISDNGKGHY